MYIIMNFTIANHIIYWIQLKVSTQNNNYIEAKYNDRKS